MYKIRACDVRDYFAKELLFKESLKNISLGVIKAFNTYLFKRDSVVINIYKLQIIVSPSPYNYFKVDTRVTFEIKIS